MDNMINGERYPDGFTPVEIKNGIYPRVYFLNTELLSPKEMRVTTRAGQALRLKKRQTAHQQAKCRFESSTETVPDPRRGEGPATSADLRAPSSVKPEGDDGKPGCGECAVEQYQAA